MRQQAEQNAELITEINNCCDLDDGDFLLQVNFGAPEARWEGCATVVVETLLFYPTDITSGTATICLDLPEPNPSNGHVNVLDPGDFTQTDPPAGGLQYCTEVEFPVEGFLDEDPGFVKAKMLMTPALADPNANPTIAVNGTVSIAGQSCNCDEPATLGFDKITSLVSPGIGAYFIEDGANISDLLAEPCNFNCLPDGTGINNIGRVLIFGELNIDEDYTFGESNNPFKSLLTLGPDSRINVKDGATFTLTDTEVSGCFEMWEAINVEPGGKFIVKPGRERSVITGGEFGVRVYDGGSAVLDGVDFIANNVSVTTPDDSLEKFPDINILGCKFNLGEGPDLERIVPSPFLLPPFLGQEPRAGVETFDVMGGLVTDRGLTFSIPNEFENLENGVVLNRTNATITDSRFRFMRGNKFRESGNGILIEEPNEFALTSQFNNVFVNGNTQPGGEGVVFEYSPRGVRAVNGQAIYVRNARFSEVNVGLQAVRSGRIRFYYNDVHSLNNGVRIEGRRRFSSFMARANNFLANAEDDAVEPSAISIEGGGFDFGNERYRIWDNAIELAGAEFGLDANAVERLLFLDNDIIWSGTTNTKATGIRLHGSSRNFIQGNYFLGNENARSTSSGIELSNTAATTINCNTTESLFTGMAFIRNNQFSRIAGNVMKNEGTGLQVGDPETSAEFHTTGQQLHRANRWLGTFDVLGASFLGDEQDVTLSRFIVDQSDENTFLPISWSPILFVDDRPNDPTPFYDGCPEGTPPGDNFTGKDPVVEKLFNRQMNWSGDYSGQSWNADDRLFDQWTQGEINTAVYPAFSAWLNSPEIAQVEELSLANQQVTNIGKANAPTEEELETALEALENNQWAYREAALAILKDAGTNTSMLIAAREQRKADLLASRQAIDNMVAVPAYVLAQDVQQARNLNNGISATELPVQNQVAINEYLIKLAEQGADAVLTDIPDILAIANQCPSNGGLAVYRARSLAAALGEDAVFDDSALCSVQKNKNNPAAENVGLFSIVPNPAINEITVSWEIEGVERIELVNAVGKVVRTLEPLKGHSHVKIYVTDLPTGVYVATITRKANKPVSKKVMISRQ